MSRRSGAEKYKGPGLAVQWVEIEGPLHDTWPPASHRRLFGDLPQAPVAGRDRNRVRGRLEAAPGRCRADPPRLHPPRLSAAGDRRRRQAVPRPREGQAGRRRTRSSRRCASASRPCWSRRTSCSSARSPASSTTSPWPAGCRTSCGVRCPTRNCSPSPSRESCASRTRSASRSSACSRTRRRRPSPRTSPASGSACATSTPRCPTACSTRSSTTCSRCRWSRRRSCSSTKC